jgi:hypothetical protein
MVTARLSADDDERAPAHRQPESIGGSHGNVISFDSYQDTREHWTSVIHGGGENYLLDHLLDVDDIHLQALRRIGNRHGREFLGIDALQIGDGGTAVQIQGLGADIQNHFNLLVRKSAHQVSKSARWNGGRPFFYDFGADPTGDAHLQVGRRQAQPPSSVATSTLFSTGKVLREDTARYDAQAASQVLLQDVYFHGGTPLSFSFRKRNKRARILPRVAGMR